MGSSELERAIALFKAGKLGEAVDACRRHLSAEPGDPRALHLLGRAFLKGGKAEEAAEALQRASSADPSNVQLSLALGSAQRAAGHAGRAAETFERVTRTAPGDGTAWFDLGLALRDQERYADAAIAFRRAARIDPSDFDAAQNVVTTLAMALRRGLRPFSAAPEVPRRRRSEGISVVVCSIDAGRLARFQERLEPHLAGRVHERIVIRDASSLSEGYRRGWEQSRYPIVIFCHDDFSIVSEDPFGEIEDALASADLVGLAGSTLASGPAVLWSGHPHVHGWIAHPAADGSGLDAAILSFESGLIPGMQTLDGVFMAMRRDVPARVGFDERTFDGFHFYDLDFSYRASRAGLRMAVTTNITGIHESLGRFDIEFERYSQRFRAKFPELAGPRGAHHWYGARLDDATQWAGLCAQLAALARRP
jgi:hypothetical protein